MKLMTKVTLILFAATSFYAENHIPFRVCVHLINKLIN